MAKRPLFLVQAFFVLFIVVVGTADAKIPSVRPPPSQRKMRSAFIDSLIDNVTSAMVDKDLATLFSNCFPNTLDTTITNGWSENDTFVITGDIDAMWLRDSSNQLPYVAFLPHATDLRQLVRGAVLRQLRSVVLDPFANSFNFNSSTENPSTQQHQGDLRRPPMQPAVFEGKYELDSLCAVLKLTFHYWKSSGDSSVLQTVAFKQAAKSIVQTMVNMSLGSAGQALCNGGPVYAFFRDSWPNEYDAFPKQQQVPDGTNLVRSAFRPSDDLTEFDFLLPSNAMALEELNHLVEMCKAANKNDPELAWIAEIAQLLSANIERGLAEVGPQTVGSSAVMAYEVNGMNDVNQKKINMMDDANTPSLLSVPLLGPRVAALLQTIAPGTRAWVLSAQNPYYFCGKVGCGVGSPHTWQGFVWPISLMVRALTSNSEQEVAQQLEMLKASAEGTGWMHESFDPNNPSNFTRPWFAWANTLFGHTVLEIGKRFPDLIFGGNEFRL